MRPLIKNLAGPLRTSDRERQPAADCRRRAPPPARHGWPAGAAPSSAMAYEQQIAQARSLVAKDPARVAQVVKDWVQKDE